MKCPSWAGLLGLTVLILAGCGQEEKTPPALPPGPAVLLMSPSLPLEESEPHVAGKKVYNANGCMSCHAMDDIPAPPPTAGPAVSQRGPGLAKVAAKPGRGVDWFIAFVGNPKKDNPNSPMPVFEKRIKPEDMRALAEFLASLK